MARLRGLLHYNWLPCGLDGTGRRRVLQVRSGVVCTSISVAPIRVNYQQWGRGPATVISDDGIRFVLDVLLE